jgi:hypothetical protein
MISLKKMGSFEKKYVIMTCLITQSPHTSRRSLAEWKWHGKKLFYFIFVFKFQLETGGPMISKQEIDDNSFCQSAR